MGCEVGQLHCCLSSLCDLCVCCLNSHSAPKLPSPGVILARGKQEYHEKERQKKEEVSYLAEHALQGQFCHHLLTVFLLQPHISIFYPKEHKQDGDSDFQAPKRIISRAAHNKRFL